MTVTDARRLVKQTEQNYQALQAELLRFRQVFSSYTPAIALLEARLVELADEADAARQILDNLQRLEAVHA
jgi:hypothetical protein